MWLTDPANFAHALLKTGDKPVRLDRWQSDYLRSKSKFVSILKSRRVGGSWIMTVKMFIRSQTIPRYSGVFVSMNREEARGKIEYADELHESLPSKWKLKRVNRSKDEISFIDSSGRKSTLRSLAAKAPRGRGGDVGVSELPHCQNASAIYEGALHVTARSMDHLLTIESTPLGKGGVFYDITRGLYGGFETMEVPWWHCSALCSDVAGATKEAPVMSTGARVKKFGSDALRAIYDAMPERAFKQESELEFVEMEDAAFPMDLIMSCAESEFGMGDGATLIYRKLTHIPTDIDWEWLKRSRRGVLLAGYDPGRKKDQAALFIADKQGEKFESRMTVSLRNVPFAAQRSVIASAIRSGVSSLRIDATGIGMDMAERLARDYPSIVKPVTFTAKSKAMMVTGAYNIFADGRMVIPAERDLIVEISSIREIVTDSGEVIFNAPSSGGVHADMAWALMLAVEAGREAISGTGPRYVSVARRHAINQN